MDTLSTAVEHLNAWFHTPFQTPLDPLDIALVVGIVMVAIIAWNFVLFHIRIAAETV